MFCALLPTSFQSPTFLQAAVAPEWTKPGTAATPPSNAAAMPRNRRMRVGRDVDGAGEKKKLRQIEKDSESERERERERDRKEDGQIEKKRERRIYIVVLQLSLHISFALPLPLWRLISLNIALSRLLIA